jgi:hypothetical protein
MKVVLRHSYHEINQRLGYKMRYVNTAKVMGTNMLTPLKNKKWPEEILAVPKDILF